MSYARISKMMSYARITKMAQRHQPTTDVRHPFYELGDKLRALREAVASDWVMVDDPALGTLLDGLTRTHDALHRHLNANYLWD